MIFYTMAPFRLAFQKSNACQIKMLCVDVGHNALDHQ